MRLKKEERRRIEQKTNDCRDQSDGNAYRVPAAASTQEDTTCPHSHGENHSTSSFPEPKTAESTLPAVEVLPVGTEVALRFESADATNQMASQLDAQSEYNTRTRRALLMLRPDFERQNAERPTVAALMCAQRTCFEDVARDKKQEDSL